MDGPLGPEAAAVGAAAIEDARRRINGFASQVRECLGRLDDAQVWSRPNEEANSVGNLVLHVCGSSRHFLGHVLGGSDYRRDRPAEFAERGPVPRAELLRVLDETVAENEHVLGALESARLMELREIPREKPHTVLALVVRTSHHWAVHTGQIVYATKALTGGGLGELWMKTMV
jgi:uncharacterized damage-inducible protein DinB